MQIGKWLQEEGLIHSYERYASKATVIQEFDDTPFFVLAEQISSRFLINESHVQVFFSDMSLCIKHGAMTHWLMPKELLKSVLSARDTVVQLKAHNGKEPPYGIGACARLIVKNLGAEQMTKDFAELIEPPFGQHYKRCRPGKLEGDFRQYDLKSAYWQIVSRMPSPYVYDVKGDVAFARPRPNIIEKWEALKSAIEGNKPLRLSMVGIFLGGQSSRCFYKGKLEKSIHTGQGKLAPCARVAIATIYNVTFLQAEEADARYSNVDSIIALRSPKFWDTLGLKYGQEAAHGDIDIKAIGAYKIGDKETDLYDPNDAESPYESPAPTRQIYKWMLSQPTKF